MVKKKTIGKIQAVLGIILFIGIVITFIFASKEIESNWDSQLGLKFPESSYLKDLSNESRLILTESRIGIFTNLGINFVEVYLIIGSFCIIVAILSIMLILQGLANMSEEIKQ
jgi:hypothetical protein